MTREAELFALARNAFRAALPSEDEAHAAARKLALRLRERARRRRLAPLLSVAFALAGALAYAAEAAPSLRAPAEPPVPVEAPQSRAPDVTPTSAPPASNAVAFTPPSPPPARATPLVTSAKPESRRPPPAPPPATWAAVARSLARGDERGARRELERLSVNGNARDRANAGVELARLAAHHGDCSRAQKHLARARAQLGSSPSLTRAEQAVKRCLLSPGETALKD